MIWLAGLAIGLLLSADAGSAIGARIRKPASPSYRARDACPVACNIAGPNPSNWSAYHNFEQVQSCKKTIFYDLSLYDDVDDPDTLHRLYACTSHGADWSSLPQPEVRTATVASVNSTYELGWWADGALAATDIRSVSKQMRRYLKSEHADTKEKTFMYARSGAASIGLYIGDGLQNDGVGAFALQALEDSIRNMTVQTGTVAMQLCNPNANNVHTFGFIASSNTTFASVQNAMRTWYEGDCLTFNDTTAITGPAVLTTPMKSIATASKSVIPSSSPTPRARLAIRAECTTTQVEGGDSCAALADRCGISGADFTEYNPGDDFCATLKPGQHVCCSEGTLPDFSPDPNEDGSCFTYTIQTDDNCADLAAQYSLDQEDLEEFNKNTWGWNGCENIWPNTIICLSEGDPPFPAPMTGAICGPQVPGTEAPEDTTNITMMNPCPLNACCDVWGQCGTTEEFCTDTGTGAPGSAEKGTNGCISNCGMEIVRGDAPSEFRSVAYFEGYSFSSRDCLYQDALQVDGSKYTHLHFAFGILTDDYQVTFQDRMTEYQFEIFMQIPGPKKILSFGGWDFSTNPATYQIFRQGVKPANRLQMATNIASFINANRLDGVDLDWEYPGAPDIPGIPPADEDDGENYLAFLVILKNLLQGKSLSIAAASSYYYLKGFPIENISKIVDYIIYMTYDLHGQWDAENEHSQIGCPSGMCLRSQVNLTETINSLVMITKAGVPSGKVVVGITSYGRSFAMADASCSGPDCFFTGGPYDSQATPGICTSTGGYIADAELNEIIEDSDRVTKQYVDEESNSDVLIYDTNQWVAYMGSEIKASRKTLYKGLNMGGTTDWATDLQVYNDPPASLGGMFFETWAQYKAVVDNGGNPNQVGNRTGNWTEVQCTDPSVTDTDTLTPSQKWSMMDAGSAWADAIDAWKTIDRPNQDEGGYSFTASIGHVFHFAPLADCGDVTDQSNCAQSSQCQEFVNVDSGAAGWAIWNSLVYIHEIYTTFHDAIFEQAVIDSLSLDNFENKFAPVPEPPDDTWLLLLIDLVTLGTAAIAAPFFNSILSKLPYFILNGNTLNNLKDTSMTVISQSTTIAKDVMSTDNPDHWTAEKQDAFSDYMGQAIDAWARMIEDSLSALFDGSDESIATLTALISDGKLLEGAGKGLPTMNSKALGDDTKSDLRAGISKAFFAFATPAIWAASGRHPFVIDSGYGCDAQDPLDDYLDEDTMHASYGCYNDKLYYIADPDGEPYFCSESTCIDNKFSMLPGVDSLDGTAFGGITVQDIIKGSVRTYEANGNQNGGAVPDPEDKATLESLFDQDITTPGFIRLPVCDPDMAFKAWEQGYTTEENYPCIPHKSPDYCRDSTFVDQTSDASPSVEDCMQIVKNIQGTDGNWEVENAIGNQHQLVQYGGCAFGVQGIGKDGNIDYYIGAQDIVDIITDSVNKFGGSGKVGAKGEMECDGTVKDQTVEWGLY
ncbi:hypothetical protein BDW72DRAFT_211523 [Aspergillus terricola var. indicus]